MKETAFIAYSSSDLVGFSHSVLLLIFMTHLYDSYVFENSLELDEQKRTIQLNVNSNPVFWLVRCFGLSVFYQQRHLSTDLTSNPITMK